MRQMGEGFGEELRRRRMAAGLSLRDLAALVHYSRGYLSKVETRHAPAGVQLARLCDAALHAGGELVALAVQDQRQPPVTGDYSGAVWAMTAGRGAGNGVSIWPGRELGTDGCASPARFPQPAPGPPSGDQVETIAASFDFLLEQLRVVGQRVSPGVALPALVAQAHTLRDLANLATGVDQAALLRLAAQYAEYTGWMMQEAGDESAALWWTSQAAQFAAAGGDLVMGVYALVRRSLICLYQEDHQQTIHLAQLAQADVSAPARVRGLAALREAQGHALAGASGECHRALDRARACLAQAGQESESPVLGTSTVPDPAAMAAGWCLHDLGHPEEAIAILGREIARIPLLAHRSRVRYAARRALAQATAGDVPGACQLTSGFLPEARDVASATVRVDLRRLARVLGRWPSNPAVRDIQPALTSVIAAGRAAT
ncbi:MAG: helix-turn-helix domain-containing protein [Streptosporangiaceae bacterium]